MSDSENIEENVNNIGDGARNLDADSDSGMVPQPREPENR